MRHNRGIPTDEVLREMRGDPPIYYLVGTPKLLAKLLAIALLQNHFSPWLQAKDARALSPLKIAAYLSRLLPIVIASPDHNWFDHFLYFCRYDSRRSPNFFQKLAALC
jgi:hypothetical protein